MFRGTSFHTLDDKGRLIIPSRFREPLATDQGELIMITRLDDCLFAYPLPKWTEIEERILALSETSDKMREFRRFFVGGVFECPLDKQGRILIPPSLRSYAGLEKEIVLVGIRHHFEIWTKEGWQNVEKNMRALLKDEAMRNDISKLGL